MTSANGTRTVSAVAVSIHGISIFGESVPTMYIIYVTVLIIVDAVGRNFSWIRPNISLQIFVIVINPCIDHRNSYTARSFGNFPGFHRIDI